MVVRAVQIDEMFAKFFQQTERDRGVVDELSCGTLRDDSADNQIVSFGKLQSVFGENIANFLGSMQGEYGFDDAGFLASSDQRFVGSFT